MAVPPPPGSRERSKDWKGTWLPSRLEIGENKIIFTMDITSLYTVIPNNEGLQALKYFFNQRPIKKPSSETLLRLAELVLTLNCFSFGDNYYKQIDGVAMGTKMGPSYANLFVGFIENKFFSNYHGPKPRREGASLLFSPIRPLPTHHYQCDVT